ncbi:MAG: adenosine deaminase [Planctomycetota bacterium]|nr:adenosine deaminase [Planctomycetota bacterium]
MTEALSWDELRALPKVLLHEHLDGGLRPETVLELAEAAGHPLPEQDPDALAEWFHRGAARGSLPLYLEGFAHTIALMQTAAALERVAFEALEDLANEGVVYAELRFAPHFHTGGELGLDAVMAAVRRGCERAQEEYGIEYGLIVCAMRNQSKKLSLKLAELASAWFGRGVVGFDLAGEEDGHPAKHHIEAFQLIKRRNGSITIHAGESFGPESIWQALQFCGAHRVGHGTHLFEDIVVFEQKVIQVGGLARYVLDHRIPIEVCLSSNVHTGATDSLEEHPFPYYLREGYRVTLNTDNRLMSATSMTKEFQIAHQTYGCGLQELERVTVNAMKAAFHPYTDRVRLIEEAIYPGYAKARLKKSK